MGGVNWPQRCYSVLAHVRSLYLAPPLWRGFFYPLLRISLFASSIAACAVRIECSSDLRTIRRCAPSSSGDCFGWLPGGHAAARGHVSNSSPTAFAVPCPPNRNCSSRCVKRVLRPPSLVLDAIGPAITDKVAVARVRILGATDNDAALPAFGKVDDLLEVELEGHVCLSKSPPGGRSHRGEVREAAPYHRGHVSRREGGDLREARYPVAR